MTFPILHALSLPHLLTLATLAVCPPSTTLPQAEVNFHAKNTAYTEEYNSAYLKQTLSANKDSTLATDQRSIVFGVTASDTTGQAHVIFRTLTSPANGKQCLYIDKAVLNITYAPTVYVSSDILDMKCSYDVTRAHEQEHVSIDYKVMQDYIPHIQSNMQAYINRYGYRGFGPYPEARAKSYQQTIIQEINVAAKPMVEALKEQRRQRQGVIDTPENYQKESNKCPNDKPMIYQKFHQYRE